MLKTRIIGVLIVRGGIVVQSISFSEYLPVGCPSIAVEYLNQWGIDEIILLDIDATPAGRSPDFRKLKEYSKNCHVPLSVGGGIRTLKDIEMLIRYGADKVVINTAAVKTPLLITEGAKEFGDQCIIVSIDVKATPQGYQAFTNSGREPTGKSPSEIARMAEAHGAGEIFLNSIDRDGSKSGLDLKLIDEVRTCVKIPVIICGGAGQPHHLLEGIRHGASAVAAANFFHFTEQSVILHKTAIKQLEPNIRTDTYAEYETSQVGNDGRLLKKEDPVLEKLRFVYVPEEVI